MELSAFTEAGPRHEIARLEVRIEQLAGKIENCRKVAVASQIAIALGGALPIAGLFGAIHLDPVLMLAAIAAVLGGIVMLGSNSSTANEASEELAATEAERARLIGTMPLRLVRDGETLH